MDVDDCAPASSFSSSLDSFGVESSCSPSSPSESAESLPSLDNDMCEECYQLPPPPPAAAVLSECSSKGILASPSQNMLSSYAIVSPDRSQTHHLCMTALPARGEECDTWHDAHDDYQGLEPFSSCRLSSLLHSPCISPPKTLAM